MTTADDDIMRSIGITPTTIRKVPTKAGASSSFISQLIMEQRRGTVPRISCAQGARDDRIGQHFSVTLDCEAVPRIGDAVVTRWLLDGQLIEQIDTVIAIDARGVELAAYYGGDAELLSPRVTPEMIRRRFVFFEGVIRAGSPLKKA